MLGQVEGVELSFVVDVLQVGLEATKVYAVAVNRMNIEPARCIQHELVPHFNIKGINL